VKDQKRCGGVDIEEEALKAALDSIASQVMDLDSDEEDGPIASSSKSHRPNSSSRMPTTGTPNPGSKTSSNTGADWSDETWTCTNCTLMNRPLALQCDACLCERVFEPAPVTGPQPSSGRPQQNKRQAPAPKPRTALPVSRTPVVDEGWTCKACGEEKMESQFWMCRFCGHIKSEPVPFHVS